MDDYDALRANLRLLGIEEFHLQIRDVIANLRAVDLDLMAKVAELQSRVNILERITDAYNSQVIPQDLIEVSPSQGGLGARRTDPDSGSY